MMGDLAGLDKLGLSDLLFFTPDGSSPVTNFGALILSKCPWPSCPLIFNPQL